jgi:hypothetical protein
VKKNQELCLLRALGASSASLRETRRSGLRNPAAWMMERLSAGASVG